MCRISQYTRQVPRRLLSVLLWSVGITVYQTGPQASFICFPVECRYHSILDRSPGVFSVLLWNVGITGPQVSFMFSCGVQISQYTRQVPRRLLSVLLWSVGITVYQTGPQASFICSPVECRYHSILFRSPGVFSLFSCGVQVSQYTRQVPRRLLSVLLWSVGITVYQTGPQASFICSPVECRYHSILDRSPGVFYLFSCGVQISQYTRQVPRRLLSVLLQVSQVPRRFLSVLLWSVDITVYQTGPQASFICSPVECRYHSILDRSPGVFYLFSCGVQQYLQQASFLCFPVECRYLVYQSGPQASFICSPVECRYHSTLDRSPGVFYLFSCGVQISQYHQTGPQASFILFSCGVQISQYTRQVPRRLLSVLLWSVDITVYQTGPQASFICFPVECRYHSTLDRSPGVFYLFSCGVQISQYTRQVPRRLLSVLLWSVDITVYQTGPQASFICSPVECRYHSILDRSPGVFYLFSCGVQISQYTRQVPRRLLSVLLWSVDITVYQTGPQASFICSPVECRYRSILDRSPGVFSLFSCGVQVSQSTRQVPRRLLSGVLLWSVDITVHQTGPQASFICSPVECRYHSILDRSPGVFYLFSCGVQYHSILDRSPGVFYLFSCGVQISQYTRQVPRRLLSVLLWSVDITVHQTGPQASFICSPVECRYHSTLDRSPGVFYLFSCGVQISQYTRQVPRRLLSVLLWSVDITVHQTGPQASFISSPVECRYHSILDRSPGVFYLFSCRSVDITVYQTGPQASFICSPVECRYHSILDRSPGVFYLFSCGVQVSQYTRQVPRRLLSVLLWSVDITVYQTGPQASFISSLVECSYHSTLDRSPGVFYLFLLWSVDITVYQTDPQASFICSPVECRYHSILDRSPGSCGVQVSQVPRRLLFVLLWSVDITVHQTGPQASFISSPVECRYHSILDRSPGVFYLFSCGVQISQYTRQVPRRLLSVLLWSVDITVHQTGPQASFICSPVECRYHSILDRSPGVFYLFSCGVQISQYTRQVPRRLLSVLLWSVGITVHQTGPQASFICSPVECRYHSILDRSPGVFYLFSCGVQISQYTRQVPRRLLSVLLWSVDITVYQTGPQASFISSPVECRYHSILDRSPGVFYLFSCGVQISQYTRQVPRRLLSVLLWSVDITVHQTGPQASFICSFVECRYHSTLDRSPGVFYLFSCGVQISQYTRQVPRRLLSVLLWSVDITVHQTGPQASFICSPVECRYHSTLDRSPVVFYLFSCGVQVYHLDRSQVPRRLFSVLLWSVGITVHQTGPQASFICSPVECRYHSILDRSPGVFYLFSCGVIDITVYQTGPQASFISSPVECRYHSTLDRSPGVFYLFSCGVQISQYTRQVPRRLLSVLLWSVDITVHYTGPRRLLSVLLWSVDITVYQTGPQASFICSPVECRYHSTLDRSPGVFYQFSCGVQVSQYTRQVPRRLLSVLLWSVGITVHQTGPQASFICSPVECRYHSILDRSPGVFYLFSCGVQISQYTRQVPRRLLSVLLWNVGITGPQTSFICSPVECRYHRSPCVFCQFSCGLQVSQVPMRLLSVLLWSVDITVYQTGPQASFLL